MAIKDARGGKSWADWPEELQDHQSYAVEQARTELKDEIDFYCFQQYLFSVQWMKLKAYANEKGCTLSEMYRSMSLLTVQTPGRIRSCFSLMRITAPRR